MNNEDKGKALNLLSTLCSDEGAESLLKTNTDDLIMQESLIMLYRIQRKRGTPILESYGYVLNYLDKIVLNES